MAGKTLSRRHFFKNLTQAQASNWAARQAERPSAAPLWDGPEDAGVTLSGGLTPYNGPWGPEQAAHLLRRVTFGVVKTQRDQLLALGSAQAAVDAVLVPLAAPPPPLNNYNSAQYTDLAVPLGETWINAIPDLDAEGYRLESWRGWWTDLMINGPANIREKMTLFWHNHFATRTEDVFFGRAIYQHNSLLRQQGLGNFKDLVKAVTLDPAMLFFLNGFLNEKSAPDENYARELQELFTIGKDSTDQYTEDDVVAAARVLTGWRVNYLNASTYFDANDHDTNDKQFSAFYNNAVIQGSVNGATELDALLDIIFDREEVSKFLCRKIYRFFVYYKIDQAVETEVIEPLAQIFRSNNYEIRPVMETLLKSEHFFDAYNKGCYIKNPLDLVVGVLRNFNLTIPASTPNDQLLMQLYLNFISKDMQMLPGDPPNVAGWQAYRQSPGYYRTWITGDTIRNRNVYSDVLALYSIDTTNDKLAINHIAFAAQFSDPGDPNILLAEMLKILLPMDISVVKKLALKSILLSGQSSDYYWTGAWNDYLANPGNQMALQTVWYRLAVLHKYIMSLPEYQLI